MLESEEGEDNNNRDTLDDGRWRKLRMTVATTKEATDTTTMAKEATNNNEEAMDGDVMSGGSFRCVRWSWRKLQFSPSLVEGNTHRSNDDRSN